MQNKSIVARWVLVVCFSVVNVCSAWASTATLVSSNSPAELRVHAATQTAQNNQACIAVQPFYWEIGNQTEALVSGSVGGKTYTANTLMPVASASKWMFGAYVVQVRQGKLSVSDIAALNMTSGYTKFGPTSCIKLLPARRDSQTVSECFMAENRQGGHNNDFDAAAVSKFHYNGGHFQKLALEFGLGANNNAALQRNLQQYLGADIAFTFGAPQLAGGINTSAHNYAIFLRKILSKQLYIGNLLGAHAVCTNPTTCSSAKYTPVPATRSWDYSLGHWVESDPVAGDGAFSSTGAFGFYPWIDNTKTYYGVLAREAKPGSGGDSSACGGLIRKAWMTGRVQ